MKRVTATVWLMVASLLHSAHGQNVYKLWDNTIQANMNGDGRFLDMLPLAGNKLMIACDSPSDSGYDKTHNHIANLSHDIWVMQLDANGNKLWDKDFGGIWPMGGLALIEPSTVILASIANGQTFNIDITAPVTPGSANISSIWLLAMDTAGNKLWNKRFCMGTDTLSPFIHATVPTDVRVLNNDIYVAGIAQAVPAFGGGDLTAVNCTNYPVTPLPGNHEDMLFYKVSAVDDTIYSEWQQLYGGDSVEQAFSILPIASGGFLIGGRTTSQASCNQTVSAYANGFYDMYVVRTDTAGAIVWQQRYGGSNNDFLNGILDAGNNNFLLYGYTLSPMSNNVSTNGYNDTSLWMVKIDDGGNIIWDKRFGSCTAFELFPLMFNYLKINVVDGINTSDGGYLFVSNVNDSLPCGDVTETGSGQEDYWLLKLDSAGNKQWDRRFGGADKDIAERVVEMSPGYYIVGGFSRSLTGGDKSEPSIGGEDLWLVGVVDSSIATAVKQQEAINGWQLAISPNPAKDNVELIIKNGEFSIRNFELYVYDITGKQLLQQRMLKQTRNTSGLNDTSVNINISKFQSGIYIVEVRDNEGFSIRKKLVKE